MTVSLVVAAAENGVIGRDNKLPWRLPADLRFFKQLTIGHTVIMGRNTYESIGKPLVDRRNIVLSRKQGLSIPGCEVFHSVEAALAACKGEEEVFVIGGEVVFDEVLKQGLGDRIYLTKVHHAFPGDTYFHIPNPEAWKVTSLQRFEPDDRNAWPYSYIRLDRMR